MIYTEVESHVASLRERWKLLVMLWRVTGEPDMPPATRRAARRLAVRCYVFSRHPRAATYIVNRNGDTD